jgi:hypothetical protein
MCLACELDALWYAEEWEQQAAAGAAGSAAVPSALSEATGGIENVVAKKAGETLASPSAPFESEGAGPQIRFVEAAKRARGMPALRSRFRCEEAE